MQHHRMGKARAQAHRCIRTCIVCGRKGNKNKLFRLGMQGQKVVLDRGKSMTGRGAYICPSTKCLEKAKKNYRNCLGRAFRARLFKEIEIDQA